MTGSWALYINKLPLATTAKELEMKVNEIKMEMEKVAKVIPGLRKDLDRVYASGPGKKRGIKLLWKEYENKYKEVRNSAIYNKLQ